MYFLFLVKIFLFFKIEGKQKKIFAVKEKY